MSNGQLPRRIVKVRTIARTTVIGEEIRLYCHFVLERCGQIAMIIAYFGCIQAVSPAFFPTFFVRQETQRLVAEPVAGISATPYQDNLRYFAVAIEGPPDSPYEKGVFQLELFLPADYPMAPPKVRFLTKIYHPNVDKLGRICLDILKDKWSPALQIRTVLLSIQALLSAPNPDDPLDNTVAEVWKNNEQEALKRAKEFTESFAMKGAGDKKA